MKTSEALKIVGGLSVSPQRCLDGLMACQLQNVKLDRSLHNSSRLCLSAVVMRSKRLLCFPRGPGCTIQKTRRPSGHRYGLERWRYLINSKKSKEFRWHDSGDVQDEEHLLKIFAVAKLTPDTKHWMPTRESWVKAFLPECPDNLCIRFSVPMVDQEPIKSWPNVSTVISSDQPWFGLSSRVCPAPTQNNECKDCRSMLE